MVTKSKLINKAKRPRISGASLRKKPLKKTRRSSWVEIGKVVLSGVIVLFVILNPPVENSYSHLLFPLNSQTLQNPLSNQLTVAAVPKPPANVSTSMRLIIPVIKVNAAVESVGITAQGTMGVPKGPSTVAWFNLGTQPGKVGSAVISGHYGRWRSGALGVFNNLSKLHKGDKISIDDGQGTVITFVVRKLQTYDPNSDASDVFGANDKKAHLNLITCEGVWDSRTQRYSKRLVVFTDKELSSQP